MIIPIFIARTPSVTLHRYGKSTMSQRKVHHVTVDSKDTSFLPFKEYHRLPQLSSKPKPIPRAWAGRIWQICWMRPDLKGLEVQGVVYPNHFHLMGGSILGIYHGNIWGTMGTETNKMRCFGCFLSHGKTQ
jgi:hypothetical protein